MYGIFFQSWFILYTGLILFFNDAHPTLLKDLFLSTFAFSTFFFILIRKKLSFENILFYVAGVLLILYSSYFGMIFLPDSQVARQKVYLRLLFYLSLFFYFYLIYKDRTKKEIIIFTVLATSHLYIFRYHYTGIVIAFYLLSNLIMLKRFTIYRKNVFDILIFLFFICTLFSTYTAFKYNGSNSVFGFFYFLSGLILFIYIKYLQSEEEIKRLIFYNLIIYTIILFLFLTFISIYLYLNNFKPNFTLNIAGFHVSNIGSIIAINLPILFSIYLFYKPRKEVLLIILLSFVMLYFTHSRSSILGSSVSCLFLILYYIKQNKSKFKIVFLPIVIFILFGIFFIGYKFSSTDVLNLTSLNVRFMIWKAYIERVFQHSILFGFGSNNEFFQTFLNTNYLSKDVAEELKNYLLGFKSNPHAHSLYIQLFYNYGIIGFFVFSLILISFITHFIIRIKKGFNSVEIIAYSVFISFLFQEFFDYTILDAMTFYPVMICLGIISRNSVNLKGFEDFHYLSSLKSRLGFIIIFFLLFFLSLISVNLVISEKIKFLFKDSFLIDNFSNLKFVNKEFFTERNLEKFESLDKNYIPINIDDKKELFSAEVYLNYYEIKKDKYYLLQAEKNLQKCIQIFPNSAICYKKLSEIQKIKNNEEQSEFYYKKYLENDPFKLVN